MEERLKLVEEKVESILKEIELIQKDLQYIAGNVKQEMPSSLYLSNSFAVEIAKKIEEEINKEGA